MALGLAVAPADGAALTEAPALEGSVVAGALGEPGEGAVTVGVLAGAAGDTHRKS